MALTDFERLSPRSQEVLRATEEQRWRLTVPQDAIGLPLLLAVLLADDNAASRHARQHLDLTSDRVDNWLLDKCGIGQSSYAMGARFKVSSLPSSYKPNPNHFDAEVHQLVAQALQEALSLGLVEIEPEHLLIALAGDRGTTGQFMRQTVAMPAHALKTALVEALITEDHSKGLDDLPLPDLRGALKASEDLWIDKHLQLVGEGRSLSDFAEDLASIRPGPRHSAASPSWTTYDVIVALQKAERACGRPLALADYLSFYERARAAGEQLPAVSTILRYFRSWQEALAAAGLSEAPRDPDFSEPEGSDPRRPYGTVNGHVLPDDDPLTWGTAINAIAADVACARLERQQAERATKNALPPLDRDTVRRALQRVRLAVDDHCEQLGLDEDSQRALQRLLDDCLSTLDGQPSIYEVPVAGAAGQSPQTKTIDGAIAREVSEYFARNCGVIVPAAEWARLLANDRDLYGDIISWGVSDTPTRERLGDPVARDLMGPGSYWPYRDRMQLLKLGRAAQDRGWKLDEAVFFGC